MVFLIIYESLLSVSGPTDPLFQKFRDCFPNLPLDTQNMEFWEWPDMEMPYTFIVSRALDARAFCEKHLLSEAFGRDDYRELCELIIKYLGGKVN